MATKDISDLDVVLALGEAWNFDCFLSEKGEMILARRTGQPVKVCRRAIERAARRGLVEWFGYSRRHDPMKMFRAGYLTPEGRSLLGSWAYVAGW